MPCIDRSVRICWGCGTCAGVCPGECLSMQPGRGGGLRPVVDKECCTDCGLCAAVCSWTHVGDGGVLDCGMEEVLHHNLLSCHVAWVTDQKLRESSASGGATSGIMAGLLERCELDGVITSRLRCAHSPTTEAGRYRVDTQIARSKEDVLQSRGSIYCVSAVNVALREVMAVDGRYAIVGLPCQLRGLSLASEVLPVLRERIVLKIGLLCSGNMAQKGTHALADALQASCDLDSCLRFRGGGFPGRLEFDACDGRQMQAQHYHEYFTWLRSFLQASCIACTEIVPWNADLIMGDLHEKDGICAQQGGKTMVLVASVTGQQALEQAARSDSIMAKLIPVSDVLTSLRPMIGFKASLVRTRRAVVKALYWTAPRGRMREAVSPAGAREVARLIVVVARHVLFFSPLTRRIAAKCFVALYRWWWRKR
jgi:coenzyme F420 hydrogenase subunit beta